MIVVCARGLSAALCGGMTKGCGAPWDAGGGRRITARANFGESWTPHNKRMHVTAHSAALINVARGGA
jgi:hypothetical protein